jgi:hypothetical protein
MDGFNFPRLAGPFRDLLRAEKLAVRLREHAHDPDLELENFSGGLLPRFHAGLVVRVDPDERRIEPHRALVDRDEHADRARGHAPECEGERVATALVERAPRAEPKSIEVVAGRDAGFDFEE